MTPENITESELRTAFRRSGIWRKGWTYQRAITTEIIARCLRNTAIAIRRKTEKNGKPSPIQQALI